MNKPLINLIAQICQMLANFYPEKDQQEYIVWWLLEEITGKQRAVLLACPQLLTIDQKAIMYNWVQEHLTTQKPLQYIIGRIPFADLDIRLKPPVLIPRPETEYWTHTLIDQLDQLKNKNITILDMCTGSGAIGLALAKALPEATVYASDIAPYALDLAASNADLNKIENIHFIHSDLFASFASSHRFDLIVSNPPYVSHQEWQHIDPIVSQWEDPLALLADDQGFFLLRQIIQQASSYIKPNEELRQLGLGQLYLEIGYQQATGVIQLLTQALYKQIKILKDLEGNDRVACAQPP